MIEIENAFLGSIIKKPENLDSLVRVSRDWFSGNNKYVYDSIMALYTDGMGVEVLTVSDKLKGLLEEKYKDVFIEGILESDFNPAYFETYQSRLEEEHLRRTMVDEMYISIKAIEKASPGEVKATVDESEGKIFQISQDIASISSLRRMGDVGKEVMAKVRAYKEEGVPSYLASTGFIDIDEMLGGFKAGEYIILAATTSQGKSALALQILRHNLADGRAVGMITLEMTSAAMFLRHVSAEARVDSLRIANGNVTSNEFDQCASAWKRINKLPFYIDDNSMLNEVTLRGAARRMVKLYNIDILVVDYIQEMDCAQNRESRQQEITRISRSIKSLAKEIKIPILVLSQLNREVVNRNPPIPRLPDLRESGALEQDADVVIFIYRPEEYGIPVLMDDITPSTGRANIIVGKARNGRTGNTQVAFIKQFGVFENIYRGTAREIKNEETDNGLGVD